MKMYDIKFEYVHFFRKIFRIIHRTYIACKPRSISIIDAFHVIRNVHVCFTIIEFLHTYVKLILYKISKEIINQFRILFLSQLIRSRLRVLIQRFRLSSLLNIHISTNKIIRSTNFIH